MGQVVVLGLISGGIYALFALGVVMVHRGTGVLTFANGEVGTAGLFLAALQSHACCVGSRSVRP
jgi:branched-subunit amino acid ABC-type transport system permease component